MSDPKLSPEEIEALLSATRQEGDATSALKIDVSPATFPALDVGADPGPPDNLRLGALMEVPLEISAELGRAVRTVRDILALRPGAIIELDKASGEPVDLMINGHLVARGEVVVVDETFGVRITDILSPRERLHSIG